jgi:ATP-binding cassette subfamily D (ALD) long-chain fatty acid import protein
MISTCERVRNLHEPSLILLSNDKLNYYKFGLGLGAVSAVATEGSKGNGGASEAAAGTADQ